MDDDDFDTRPSAEVLGKLFGEVDRSMLAAGAAELDHQVLESTLLIIAQAGVD